MITVLLSRRESSRARREERPGTLNSRRERAAMSSRQSALEDPLDGQLRRHSIQSPRENRQLTGRHRRKEMVLDVVEHIVRKEGLDAVSDGAGEQAVLLAAVMHRPDGEERREALAGGHGHDVV